MGGSAAALVPSPDGQSAPILTTNCGRSQSDGKGAQRTAHKDQEVDSAYAHLAPPEYISRVASVPLGRFDLPQFNRGPVERALSVGLRPVKEPEKARAWRELEDEQHPRTRGR